MSFRSKPLQAWSFRFASLLAGFAVLILMPLASLAQTSLGTLTGVVRDSSGAVVASATVTATNTLTSASRTTKSTTLGAYRFDALTPGSYVLAVEVTGFDRAEAKNIAVSPSQTVSYDVALHPGRVDQTVSVTAGEVLINQENGSLSGTISSEQLSKLPIFTLNPVEVLTTIPGVQTVSNTGEGNGEQIQVSGARSRANNFMVDGEEINDATIAGQAVQPNIPDMYSDVVIYTHNAPAEYGRASGGVVNLITKGGSNTFHGSAWELYSGSGLDAVDGQTRQLTPDRGNKTRWNQHQYGFTLGGPALKDKLFGFGAAQWSRYYGMEQASQLVLPNTNGVALLQTIEAGSNSTTATNAALLLQYLSNASYLNTFHDFSGDTPYTTANLGSACPTSDACAMQMNLYRRPSAAIQNPDTQWTYRIDYTPTRRDTFSARYLHDRNMLTPDFFNNGTALPGFDTYQGGPSELGQGAWTHIFSSALLNEFRVAETRLHFYFAPTAETESNALYNAPVIGFGDSKISSLGFSHASFPQGRGQDMYQLQDTLSWTHGRNTVRVGADIGRRIETDLVSQNTNGTLTFAKSGSGITSVGNFLLNQLGPSGTATRTFGSTRFDPHSWRSGVFFQDDFKLLPNLTLNLGARYDYYTSPENSLTYPAIDPDNPYTAIDTVYKVTPDKNNFTPRVGFAYSPDTNSWLGNGNTVIRGGFGMFFDSDFTNIAINEAQSAPNAVSSTLTQTTGNGLADATGLIDQMTATLSPKSSVLSIDKNLVAPYSEEWNLGFERQLPGQFGLSVTYAGSHGIKLYANEQFNYFSFDTGLRLNTTRGAVNARMNSAGSSYNGLEVGLKHVMGHGLTVQASYVYSKTMDDGSEVFTPDSAPTSYASNLARGGRSQDWANSAYDHRNYAAFSYVWTPKGLRSDSKGLNTLLGVATRNWTISGTSRFQSGAYSTVNYGGLDSNGDGNAYNDRPTVGNKSAKMDTVGIDGIYLGADTTGTYYDLAANNATGAVNQVDPNSVRWLIPYGPEFTSKAIGRNSFKNPGVLYNDIALEKGIPASFIHFDRGQFVIRCEAQNIANHNNVGLLDVNLLDVGTSSFLDIPSVRETNNRNVRFWAKFVF